MRRSSPSDEPVLITSAPKNPEDEYEWRRKKYAIMMTLRAVCVIAAAMTYRISLWLALAFVIGGMVLPWCAVIIANDGPPKKRARQPVHHVASERALPSAPSDHVING